MSIWMGEKGERVREREGEFEIKTVLSLKLKKTTINPPSSCPSLVCADFCLNILVYTKRQKHIYAIRKHKTTNFHRWNKSSLSRITVDKP